jgi:hypothetical protein
MCKKYSVKEIVPFGNTFTKYSILFAMEETVTGNVKYPESTVGLLCKKKCKIRGSGVSRLGKYINCRLTSVAGWY